MNELYEVTLAFAKYTKSKKPEMTKDELNLIIKAFTETAVDEVYKK